MGKLTCQDLMVGDWIEDGYKKSQVTSITCDGIVETTAAISNIEVVDPIPLTEEILEKNGFDRQYYDDGNSYWWAVFDGWFNVNFDHSECSEGEFRCVGFSDLVINYVHQLQHLLRLCGIEKELIID